MTQSPAHSPRDKAPAPSAPPLNVQTLEPRLASIVDVLGDVHRRLVTICDDHRRALKKADAGALAEINTRHAAALNDLKAIDADRRKLAAAAASTFGTSLKRSRGTEPTLADLASLLPERQRPVLMARIDDLRILVRSVERSTATLKIASRHLASHMEGLLRVVATRLNHSGVYGRAGNVSAGAAVMSGLDVRT